MRRRWRILLTSLTAVAIAGASTGCTASTSTIKPPGQLTGQWVLVTGSDATGRLPLDNSYITLTLSKGDAAAGRSTCSDYRARVVGQPGPVFISVLDHRIAECVGPQRSALDGRYLKALSATTIASVDGGYLTLSSPHTALEFHRSGTPDTKGILDIGWTAQYETITEPDGASSQFTDPAGGLTLHHDGNFVLDVGHCPPVHGKWIEDAGEIVFGHLTNATASCSTPDDEQNRTDVMSALVEGFQFSITDGTLATLNPRNHNLMTFVESAR